MDNSANKKALAGKHTARAGHANGRNAGVQGEGERCPSFTGRRKTVGATSVSTLTGVAASLVERMVMLLARLLIASLAWLLKPAKIVVQRLHGIDARILNLPLRDLTNGVVWHAGFVFDLSPLTLTGG